MNRTNVAEFSGVFSKHPIFTNTCVNTKYFLSTCNLCLTYQFSFIKTKIMYLLWNNEMTNRIFISLGEQSHTERGPVQLSSRWDSRQFTNLNKLSHLLPGYMIIGYYYRVLYYYCEKSPRYIYQNIVWQINMYVVDLDMH